MTKTTTRYVKYTITTKIEQQCLIYTAKNLLVMVFGYLDLKIQEMTQQPILDFTLKQRFTFGIQQVKPQELVAPVQALTLTVNDMLQLGKDLCSLETQ